MKGFAKEYAAFETPAGICAVAWNETGITGFQLAAVTTADIDVWRRRRAPGAVTARPDACVSRVIDSAIRYFSGEVIDFSDTMVDLRGQSEFSAKIYSALRKVPYGKTTTYGELARGAGAGPERSREVGVAMATNPVPLIIPCHRVLAAGGRLGGFSAPGGAESKLKMLRLEGATVAPEKVPRMTGSAQSSFAF